MPPFTNAALLKPEAAELLQKAATAAGLTVTQLVDLVADSGALALPPAQAATPMVTMRDLGKKLWMDMQTVSQTAHPEWFTSLLPTQQRALIVTLRDRGYRSEVIAQDLGLSALQVARIYNEHADNLGAQVVSVRLNTLAGQVQLAAERAQQGLMEKDDWKGYWSVAKDMVGILQNLGIVDRAVGRVEVTHKFHEQTKAEVDAMLDLERKKRVRMEELKNADFKMLDEAPQIELEGEHEL